MTTDTVDWEALKALDKADDVGKLSHELYAYFTEILASHERDQRVIEAAEKLRELLKMYREEYVVSSEWETLFSRALAEFDKAKGAG